MVNRTPRGRARHDRGQTPGCEAGGYTVPARIGTYIQRHKTGDLLTATVTAGMLWRMRTRAPVIAAGKSVWQKLGARFRSWTTCWIAGDANNTGQADGRTIGAAS